MLSHFYALGLFSL